MVEVVQERAEQWTIFHGFQRPDSTLPVQTPFSLPRSDPGTVVSLLVEFTIAV